MRAPSRTVRRAKDLRRAMSLPELLLWDCLRAGRLGGHRFRRQHPVGPYVLDFFCPSARLAVEVDGSHHDLPESIRHDAKRDRWLAEHEIRVMRIAAHDILDDHGIEGVVTAIAGAAGGAAIPAAYRSSVGTAPPPPPAAVPLPRFAGEDRKAHSVDAADPHPFTGEGDHAKRGGGGAKPMTADPDFEGTP